MWCVPDGELGFDCADTAWDIGSISGSGSEAQDLETCFVLGELVQVQVGDRPGTLWLLYPTLPHREVQGLTSESEDPEVAGALSGSATAVTTQGCGLQRVTGQGSPGEHKAPDS